MLDPTEENLLLEATRAAVLTMGVDIPIEVVVEHVEGTFARVRVRDRAGKLTPMFGFAVRRAAGWKTLAFGTGFEADFYLEHGIPERLKLG